MNWKKIKEEHVGQLMLVYAAHGEMAVGCVEKNKDGEFFATLFTKGSPPTLMQWDNGEEVLN